MGTNLNEMARLAREALLEFIQPVILLSVNPNMKTGAVTGRFRSSGMVFDYDINKKVNYKPVGVGRASRADAIAEARTWVKELLGSRQDTRCQKPDGTVYGTGGKCKQGRELRRRSSADGPGEGRAFSEQFGMKYSGANERVVRRARSVPDEQWDKLPVSKLPSGTPLQANEKILKTKPINKVVSGKEPFREGYVTKLWKDGRDRLHVVDGHHRVAMYHALGKDMPVRIMTEADYKKMQGRGDAYEMGRGEIAKRLDTRCQKPDGTVYGTAGGCKQGRELRRVSSRDPERKAPEGYDRSEPKNPPYCCDKKVEKAAKALRAKIAKLEPGVSEEMIDLASKYGARLDGFEYRLKAEKSLGRKIENEYKTDEFGGDVDKCANSMSDVVRYTVMTSNAKYTATVENALSDLRAKGYTTRVKNYWEEGQPYRGLNVALTSPEGLNIELQFHTPQSMYVKKKTHVLYEAYREEKDDNKRRKMFDAMVQITDKLIPPWGAAATGRARSPKVQSVRERTKQQRERLLSIGTRKKNGFQTAKEAGLVD